MSDYRQFLDSKLLVVPPAGIEVEPDAINPKLFPFQRDLVVWALRKGRAAIWADTGLGKTFAQLEWARLTGQRTLIIAPLSVARQTIREGCKIGVEVRYVRGQAEVQGEQQLWITNYEMLDNFTMSEFGAVVLDESSILKALDGKTRHRLTVACANVPYRLCCTATPAPNDYTELGNHAEFLGICTTQEMLATYFINANKQQTIILDDRVYEKKGSNKGGQEWRIKHHAEAKFFRWLASWAITLTKPSDLGYDDDGFILPPLEVIPEFVHVDYTPDDQLMFTGLRGITDRVKVRRDTIGPRLELLKRIVSERDGQWIIWCGLDEESRLVAEALPDAVEVKGSQSPEHKAECFEAFQDGAYRVLVSKARIAGFGMNFQNASHMAFFGLNDSWEAFYQCIRREWRYGQSQPVDVHLVLSDAEAGIYQNIMRKDAMAKRLRSKLIEAVRDYETAELGQRAVAEESYRTDEASGEGWRLMLGDSCERLREIETGSVDLSVYSPPFVDLFTYTDSDRDLGNSHGWEQFFRHYEYIIREMLRVTKPGRLTCVHTADIPAMLARDGYIGLQDFPGAVIKAHIDAGWIYHGRTAIDKNPQAQALRTHAKNLLFAQLEKDATWSRSAIADYILIFRKPGENITPVLPVANGDLNRKDWILWARPIWYAADYEPGSFEHTGLDDYKSGSPSLDGIRETETLQAAAGRGASDEKHICPLQLGTIERCIKLYSNPGELVLSPFAGIGSELYTAVKFGRRAIGCELKPEYWQVAVRNLREIERQSRTPTLFDIIQPEAAGA